MTQNKFLTWLEEGRVLVGDGAMGTMLQASGLTDGGAPELWNVTHPDRVQAVYQAYVDAGSNLIETNTFGGSPRAPTRPADSGWRCEKSGARARTIAWRCSSVSSFL